MDFFGVVFSCWEMLLFGGESMPEIVAKYFFIFLSSFYIFTLLEKKKVTAKMLFYVVAVSALSSALAYQTRLYVPFATFSLVIVMVMLSGALLCRRKIPDAFPEAFVSVILSYITSFVAGFFAGSFFYIAFKNELISSVYANMLPASLLTGAFQIFLTLLIFKNKRLCNALIEYLPKLRRALGVFICVSLILASSFLNESVQNERIKTAAILFIVFFSVVLFLWIRERTSDVYHEKVYERNSAILSETLERDSERIRQLSRENSDLSKIIHRDNKIIPAMEMALEEILSCSSPEEQKARSQQLLPQIKAMSQERKGIISSHERSGKTLPKTGSASIDASLSYLCAKASERNVDLDVSVLTDIGAHFEKSVLETDLNTLLLDHGENALIAVSHCRTRKVLIVFSEDNDSLKMSVFDSGEPFDDKVKKKLGRLRVTTHKDEGGSGIGMMTTFEILKKYKASFTIDEQIDNGTYTKKVCVCFDGKGNIKI